MLVYQNIDKVDGFVVKGKKFSIAKLLQNNLLAASYEGGSMMIARLCPTDYHRYHFPCDGVPGEPKLINGPLWSVNPIALHKNIEIFTENKRVITEIETEKFDKILYIEVGATCVGSIHNTFKPHRPVKKGDEKGYFSFGGSAIILLFKHNCIRLDHDLVRNSEEHLETLCQMGQSLGKFL